MDVISAALQLNAEGTVYVNRFDGVEQHVAYLAAYDSVAPLTQATVTANGASVPFNAQEHAYSVYQQTPFLNLGAANTLTVKLSGKPDFNATVELPGDFQLINAPATVQKQTAFTLAWSASNKATSYSVEVYDANSNLLFGQQLIGQSVQIPGLSQTGDVFAFVTANLAAADRHLAGAVRLGQSLTVTP